MSRSGYLAKRWRGFVVCAVAYALTLNVVLVALLGAQIALASSSEAPGRFEICLSQSPDVGPTTPWQSSDQKVRCITTCTACIQLSSPPARSPVTVRWAVYRGVWYARESGSVALSRVRDPAKPTTGPPPVA
jgi:hypothetical protein